MHPSSPIPHRPRRLTNRVASVVALATIATIATVATAPARTDAAVTYESIGRLAARTTVGLAVAGRGAVPANATSVQLDVSIAGASADGFLIVHPCAVDRRWTPTLNFLRQTPAAQTIVTEVGPNGGVCFYTSADAEVLVDIDNIVAAPAGAPAPAPTTAPTTTPTTSTPIATTTTPPSTTAPATTAPPAAAPAPAPAVGTSIGSQQYPVPTGAIVVATNGNDSAAGTASAPLRTVTRAIAVAPTGGTIVLRAGSYSESVTVTKRVTIQAWPGEQVWFDGSQPVTNWVADGSTWRSDNWTTEFDSSPTYTRGASDSSAANWGFVNPSYPMAAHPDQIWIDGTALRQVSSRSAVVAGTFFHDKPGNRLYIGSSPSGRQVRASTLVRAFMVRADGTVLRGFGIRRYAPSVPDMGAVTLERPGARVEHVAIIDSATTGLSVLAANAVLTNVHIARSGMLGLQANHADNLSIQRLLSENNNTERFNQAPVSGGFKTTRSRVVTVRDSIFRNNEGPGLWFDESTYDIKILNVETRSNAGHGISLEISAKAVVADNVVTNNGGFGIKVNDISDVKIWNNTFIGNDRNINIVQDNRRYGDGSPGKDPRYPNDPTMTWLIKNVSVSNNVIAAPTRGNCLLCVEDYSRQRTAEQMGVVANGNVYSRPSSTPNWVVVWSRGASNPGVFTTLSAFTSATGQELSSAFLTAAVVDSNGVPTARMPSASIARPLPSDIAALIGQPAGAQKIGAF